MIRPIRLRITPAGISEGDRLGFQLIPGRSEERSTIALAVTIFGFNSSGRLFQELASTRNVSRHGCCIHMRTKPQSDTPLALRIVPRGGPIPEGTPPLTYRFVWSLPVSYGWEVGAVALEDSDLMRLAFPQRKP
jgi:hypothetical protein